MQAASHRSAGRLVEKNMRATMMLYTETENGKISTQNESYSPKFKITV